MRNGHKSNVFLKGRISKLVFSYYLTQTLKTNAVICGKIFYEELREKRQINRCLAKVFKKSSL